MAQRSMDFYFSKKPITSETKPNKRKALKISSDEDESPGQSKSIGKKKPRFEESHVSIKNRKIKAESVAALFGGELRRENKKKATHSPNKNDNHVDCKLEPVSDTSFSTPTKSDNASTTLRRSRSPKKLSLVSEEKSVFDIPTPTKSDNASLTLRRSSRTPKKLSSFPEKKLSPQKKETIKCEFEEEASTQFRMSPRKHESVKHKLVEETSNGNANKKQRDQEGSPVKVKSTINKSTKQTGIKLKQEETQLDTKRKTHKEASASDLETSVLSDEERFERKRMAAILYQKRLNRPSVINPGSKEAPKGAPNCLSGLSFCITGVLESFTSEEAAEIIKDLGGKMSTNVGKRLNYLVAGEDAGPKKLSVAESLNIPVLNLDELFDLIREKSNNKSETKTGISPRKKRVERTSPYNIKQEDIVSPEEVKNETGMSPKKNFEKISSCKQDDVSRVAVEKMSTIKVCNEAKTKADSDDLASKKVNDDNIAWVDKYKPTSLKQIIGQQGAASNCTKLLNWLKNWHSNQSGKKKLQKPNPWAKNDDGSYYKAALLSGPPGVGKTTTATLVCKELGFDTVEFNASDTRSKRLLKEDVSELLSNKSLYGYFHGNVQAVSKKHVLIMDEVDGMAGNEDRGGIQELIALIKDSHVPIICMCNDRNHQKMRSLVNYCYDLRFIKPRLEQIKGFVKSICFKEKVKLSSEKIDEIILATNNDIRQSINHLCLLSAGKDIELTFGSEKTAQKDLKMGPWEVVRKVFSADEHKHMSLVNKLDLFFHDYSMSPLFVQQNYLTVCPDGPRSEVLKKVALSADALSIGDLVDRRIRTNSAWTLLPVQAVFSSFLPGEYMEGHFTGQINFPGWLGKYSRTNKRSRLAQEIHDHTRLRTSGSRLSIRMDYSPFLLSHIVRPLQDKGMQGVAESLKVIQEYRLLREDIDSLIELTTWPGKKSPMDAVEGKTKAALTRLYNKEVLPYSYSAITAAKKKKCEAADGDIPLDLMENETETVESDEEQDNLENDNLIKAKKTTLASSKPTGSKSNKTTSSQKTSSVKTRK